MQGTVAAGAALAAGPARSAIAANDQLNVGIIGLGTMGQAD